MTDDVSEAEEMRIQTLASDCVAELRNSNESGWVAVRGGCWQTRPLEVPIAEALAGTHFPWPQDQVIRLHGADRVAVLGLSGVMEQRKQLSVVTDGSVGVYGPTIVLGSPTTASGEGRHTIRAILTLQISRP